MHHALCVPPPLSLLCVSPQMADFFHRTEVRDITGHCNSLLFNPDDFPEYRRLKRGSTCFVRYASKAYFSDLMTQVSSNSSDGCCCGSAVRGHRGKVVDPGGARQGWYSRVADPEDAIQAEALHIGLHIWGE